MKYKVHHLKIDLENDQDKLELFLNNLAGDLIAIIPNNQKMSLLQIYGVTPKINRLFIIEKLAQ